MRRSRTTLVLMEQILMVLVFALAAALCLQVFFYAGRQSAHNDARDRAVALAQSAAETLKYCGGDMGNAQAEAAQRLGGQLSQGVWYILYDKNWSEVSDGAEYAYRLEAQGLPSGVDGLWRAQIRVMTEQKENAPESLFALTVAWQEEGQDE